MKHTALKNVFLRLAIAILYVAVSIPAKAQYYMNIFQKDRASVQYTVSEVDSTNFSALGDSASAVVFQSKYYMNVFHKNGSKVSYVIADIDSVSITDKIFTHEYVDLGLSVLWATCNVGAVSPEEYGEYYAWGETEPKSDYSWSTYKFCNGSEKTLTKYCKYSYNGLDGFTDNKTELDPEDDVVHVKWGGEWRMPTIEEFDELINNCYKYNVVQNGIEGIRFESRILGYEDRYLFIPFAGQMKDSSLDAKSYNYGYYWSDSYSSTQASYYKIYSRFGYGSSCVRAYGCTVRPVRQSEAWIDDVSILLSCESRTMVPDGNYYLKATVKKGNSDISYPVVWATDNPSVASVDENGHIRALSSGTAIISASIQNVTAECAITVIDSAPEYEYVDLGLSVNWATFNVGALYPEDNGGFYTWGDISAYNEDSREDHIKYWMDDVDYTGLYGLTKYCTNSEIGYKGFTDNKIILDPEDDVVHAKWGGDWRMPTAEEWQELIDYCDWEVEWINGVSGYRIRSRVDWEKSIFLPAIINENGYCRNYWSSSLFKENPEGAWSMQFDYDDWYGLNEKGYMSQYGRYSDLPVRPVCPTDSLRGSIIIYAGTTHMIPGQRNHLRVKVFTESGRDVSDQYSVKWDKNEDDLCFIISEDGWVYVPENWNYYTSTYVYARIFAGDKEIGCQAIEIHATSMKDPKYEFVDLGLSVKWATMNVGAYYNLYEKDNMLYYDSEGGSDVFAWGQLSVIDDYESHSYIDVDSYYYDFDLYMSDIGNKYSTGDTLVLGLEDDVAHFRWGGNWRMPTKEEFEELIENCTWSIVKDAYNHEVGYNVTSNIPDYTNCTIFFPMGSYWSSSCDGVNWDGGEFNPSSRSYCLDVRSSSYIPYFGLVYYYGVDYEVGVMHKNTCRFVRPVCP